jgi:DnaJ-class molecular chaperone
MKCSKCKGTGIINSFFHVSNGVCFDCMGSGFLAENKKHTVKYALSFVKQFLQKGYFNGEGKVEIKKIQEQNHVTAVKMLMEDSNFYYIGQPVCGGSTSFKFPKEIKEDFIKMYKKTHFGKDSDI